MMVPVGTDQQLRQKLIEMLAKVEDWTDHCGSKRRAYCEDFGCSSLWELVAPFKELASPKLQAWINDSQVIPEVSDRDDDVTVSDCRIDLSGVETEK